ncbi:MAG: RluA family pseudouridine synthase [Bacteroidales bacterium]|nr:RluA family pseudouridine synthase [Bacteroidales bacterium]
MIQAERILYEDNHILIYNKMPGELVQPDKENLSSLEDELKLFIKKRDQKKGNVFLGVLHRIDRPVSGVVVFAKTSKALARLNSLQQERNIKKIYWAITANIPPQPSGRLEHTILRNEKKNKSYVVATNTKNSKLAILNYSIIAHSDRYHLWEIILHTGRHHQIRCQLAHIGCPIKGDVKYGFRRANRDLSISLHARHIEFVHPIHHITISVTAPVPNDNLWKLFEKKILPNF